MPDTADALGAVYKRFFGAAAGLICFNNAAACKARNADTFKRKTGGFQLAVYSQNLRPVSCRPFGVLLNTTLRYRLRVFHCICINARSIRPHELTYMISLRWTSRPSSLER